MSTLGQISAVCKPTLRQKHACRDSSLITKAVYDTNYTRKISRCTYDDEDIMLQTFCYDNRMRRLKYQDHERHTRDLEYKAIIEKERNIDVCI